jgi:hypothetical protein
MVHAYIEKVIKEHGVEAARELSPFQAELAYAMKQVAEKEKFGCDMVLTRCMETFLSQSHADEQKAICDKELANGLALITDVDFIGLEYAETVSSHLTPIHRSIALFLMLNDDDSFPKSKELKP